MQRCRQRLAQQTEIALVPPVVQYLKLQQESIVPALPLQEEIVRLVSLGYESLPQAEKDGMMKTLVATIGTEEYFGAL